MKRPHIGGRRVTMPCRRGAFPVSSMARLLLLAVVLLCFAVRATAQGAGDSIRTHSCGSIRTHSYMVGLGSTHQLDTYLSHLNYSGYQVSLLRETLRMTRLAGHRISFQTLWQGTFSHSTNLLSTSTDWGGHVGYDALWHYNWTPLPGLRLLAGGAVGADAGFLYNSRGGNNPAQGRFCLDLSASLMAVYRFRLWGADLGLRYQANMPALGVLFSPQFGQSYYEIGEGHLHGNVCFSHPGNAFSLWQQLTLDVPLARHVTLRAGYLCDIRQSHVHHIKVHDRSHSFMVGFVTHFRRIGRVDRRASAVIL